MLCMQVEAGAQVIITQLFYDVERFIKFCKDCKALGIECPIIPGLSHHFCVMISCMQLIPIELADMSRLIASHGFRHTTAD